MKKNTLTILATIFMATTIFGQTVTTYTDGTPDDDMAIESNGNLYASNWTGDTVFKYDENGNGEAFITGLNTPNGLAFDSNDNLYICDHNDFAIYKYDIDGNFVDSFEDVSKPSGIVKAFDNDDMIFTSYNINTVNRLNPNGTITLISSDPNLNGPVGIDYDENGILYVGNYNDRKIYRILEDGTAEYIAQLPTDGGAFPNLGFITYAQGMLWGTTMGSDKIFRINPNEIDDYTLFAGSIQGNLDGDISIATFNTTNGIIFNEAEDIMYITDFGSKNIRKISGVILETNDQEMFKSDLIIYPNPVMDVINIKSLNISGDDYSIRIFDSNGKIIYLMENVSLNNTLEVSIPTQNWARGIYYLKLSTNNSTITKKVIR